MRYGLTHPLQLRSAGLTSLGDCLTARGTGDITTPPRSLEFVWKHFVTIAPLHIPAQAFLKVYAHLRDELLDDDKLLGTQPADARTWLKEVLKPDYLTSVTISP